MKAMLGLMVLVYSSVAFADTEIFNIDSSHSFANFTIRHVVAKTSGSFNDVSGLIKINREDLAQSSVNATINVASVNTGLAKRDQHIQKPEYLNAQNFAKISFVSEKIVSTNALSGEMIGKLSMNGVTKTISMPFKVLGFGPDPWGGERSGFEASTTIKASDFGFTWMKKVDASVGDDIEITLLIEAIKAK